MKHKVFAKADAPRKIIIFALQISNKQSIIINNISINKVSKLKPKFSSKTLRRVLPMRLKTY